MEALKKFWNTFKLWMYKYIGGLFLEEKKDGQLVVSIGRVMLMVVFLIMVYFWVFQKVQEGGEGGKLEMPDMLYETFVALATYVFGSKVAGALKTKWGGSSKSSSEGP